MKRIVSMLAVAAFAASPAVSPLVAQTVDPVAKVEAQKERTERVAHQLWEWAELG